MFFKTLPKKPKPPKTQKSQNPKIPKPQNPKNQNIQNPKTPKPKIFKMFPKFPPKFPPKPKILPNEILFRVPRYFNSCNMDSIEVWNVIFLPNGKGWKNFLFFGEIMLIWSKFWGFFKEFCKI